MFNTRRAGPSSGLQVSSMDEERFEIVEYTSTSYWDRFVNMVEEVFKSLGSLRWFFWNI